MNDISHKNFLKDMYRDKLKIFLIIFSIFLLSRAAILASCVFIPSLDTGKMRWVSKYASITMPDKPARIYIGAKSFKKQKLKIYENQSFLQEVALDEDPTFFSVTLKGGSDTVEFVAEESVSPHAGGRSGQTKKKVSWELWYLGTDRDFKNLIGLGQGISVSGIHQLMRRPFEITFRNNLEESLIHHDALRYVGIVDSGYEWDGDTTKYHNIVWPFLYPFFSYLMKTMFPFLGTVWACVITNNLLFFFSLFFIYYLSTILTEDPMLSYLPVVFLAFHPFAVFLTSAFSEGAFILFLSMGLVLLVRKKYFSYAVVAGALSGIRIIGIISPFILVYDYFIIQKNKLTGANLLKVASLSLVSLWGLFSFMIYQKIKFDDFFAFVKAHEAWEKGAGSKMTVLFYSFAAYVRKMPNFLDPNALGLGLAVLIIIFCAYHLLARRKELSRVEHIFAVCSLCLVLIPLMTVKLSSIGRYTVVSFPVLILLSSAFRRADNIFAFLWLSFSACEAVFMTMLFSQKLHPF